MVRLHDHRAKIHRAMADDLQRRDMGAAGGVAVVLHEADHAAIGAGPQERIGPEAAARRGHLHGLPQVGVAPGALQDRDTELAPHAQRALGALDRRALEQAARVAEEVARTGPGQPGNRRAGRRGQRTRRSNAGEQRAQVHIGLAVQVGLVFQVAHTRAHPARAQHTARTVDTFDGKAGGRLGVPAFVETGGWRHAAPAIAHP
ncbi:hypothetical protein D3C86_1192030 [compost metagenome]